MNSVFEKRNDKKSVSRMRKKVLNGD